MGKRQEARWLGSPVCRSHSTQRDQAMAVYQPLSLRLSGPPRPSGGPPPSAGLGDSAEECMTPERNRCPLLDVLDPPTSVSSVAFALRHATDDL